MREIACDESGYEGERLIGSTTRLFAHASVGLTEPAAVLAELRARIRSPATEYKANHLLRPQHRKTLRWFLGESGPVHGRGHVFLLDKAAFVRQAFAEHIGGEFPDPRTANELLRVKGDPDLDVLEPPARQRAATFREWLSADPIGRSVLDPLTAAHLCLSRLGRRRLRNGGHRVEAPIKGDRAAANPRYGNRAYNRLLRGVRRASERGFAITSVDVSIPWECACDQEFRSDVSQFRR